MKKIIIGFTGEMGCGKDTATDYIFQKYGGKKFKFSQVLRDILSRIFIESSRENLQALSTNLRQTFGQDILAKIMKNDLDMLNENIVLIDGIRRKEDIVFLGEMPEFKLIYIESTLENRYSRILNRGENSDDLDKTFGQFLLDQDLETEVTIRGLKEISDYIITNNGTLEELYAQIEKILSI
ncbi:MAG: AAA family ATPase [Candidatus Gracilibacteria bacterium]|nr:AAA family ATPase [Candidatus Gracilibacteria bacterium]MDD2908274.1 AAA family ATPase [Candidatus Gracilibacteria bacterium]